MSSPQDFRSLPSAVRADRRRLAFEMMDDGCQYDEIMRRVHVKKSTLSQWKKHRKDIEQNNYHGAKRGRQDDQRLLNDEQQKEVITAIKESTPEEHGVAAYLWSRRAIAELVQTKYDVTLIEQRVSKYTQRWGFSPQRPRKHAMEQDEEKVRKWLEEDYPAIVERATKEGAEIHWGDETNLNINTNYQRTYAPKGETPILKIPARKTSYSLVSSLTNQGKLRYMAYKGGMNAQLFKIFLNRLIKDTDKKVFLIVDNLRVHHAKIIQAWQKEHTDQIEIFFPPTILPARQS